MQHTKSELIKLWANSDKRRAFAQDYKSWGVWLTVPELGQTYYKYELPDGVRLIAMEYQREDYYSTSSEGETQTITVHYLWKGKYFIPFTVSDYAIADHLKVLKMQLQKELKGSE